MISGAKSGICLKYDADFAQLSPLCDFIAGAETGKHVGRDNAPAAFAVLIT
ncbi:hypothetical protein QA648_03255 [Rhizobium sp. CB3171]|uniref:hypothetical protein n=1 Tax=unclassified Rhizobium TaxID=2613769 RepID=UPI0021A52F28|nr:MULTISPECIES: hypothetical protein [Rhizobium]MDK4738927.1 hypothetical protein [Rhizobium sp. CNPSo 3464]UWU21996.1 hypothetical protein N2601_03170 [Rhizobium tropici]WFU02811.1 hypothetical protein QA648_03255 [Rhizobium sp. CB3171]